MSLIELLLVQIHIPFVEVVDGVRFVQFDGLFVFFNSLVHDDIVFRAGSSQVVVA